MACTKSNGNAAAKPSANLGFMADFGPEHADTIHRDLHPDYIFANGSISFNQSGEGKMVELGNIRQFTNKISLSHDHWN